VLLLLLFVLAVLPNLTLAETPSNNDINDAIVWLETKAAETARASRVTMKDGTAAFPPQIGIGYKAFWLRDYAYTLEGAVDSFSDKELIDACRVFLRAQRADGQCVDCVKFDGKPIYRPGFGSMGVETVADGAPFTVDVAWYTYKKTQDKKLLAEMLPALEKAMQTVELNPKNGLVYIRPGMPQYRCPYGFTDTILKQGDVLFCSLLYVQASGQLADLYRSADKGDDAARWSTEAERVARSIRTVFWNPKWNLFRAATVKSNQPDVWGSAFAVYLGVADEAQSKAIARNFQQNYDKYVQKGQIRHLPKGQYWEDEPRGRDRYQNGAYWATPTGWFVYTLDLVDSELAERTVFDLIDDFKARGICEWVIGDKVQLPGYNSSVSLPAAGVHRMLKRREREKVFSK
jgi:glycogen debranching enzyme